MNERLILVLVFLALFIKELWTLIPEGPAENRFPFTYQEIKWQGYFWIVCMNIVTLIYISIFWHYSTYLKLFFGFLFWIQVAEFFEFFLTYNRAIFVLYGINVNVTNLRYFIMFFVGTYTLIRWKQTA